MIQHLATRLDYMLIEYPHGVTRIITHRSIYFNSRVRNTAYHPNRNTGSLINNTRHGGHWSAFRAGK